MRSSDVLIHFLNAEEVWALRTFLSSTPLGNALSEIVSADAFEIATILIPEAVANATDYRVGGKGSMIEARHFAFGTLSSWRFPFTMLWETFFSDADLETRGIRPAGSVGQCRYVLSTISNYNDFETALDWSATFANMPILLLGPGKAPDKGEWEDTSIGELTGNCLGFLVNDIYDGESLLVAQKVRAASAGS